jgi:hypothetical protein
MGLKLPQTIIPRLDSTDATPFADKTIHARLFALGSAATWLLAEYDPVERIAFGYCDLFGQGEAGGAEWGYVSIDELEELRFLGIPRVEVDHHFTPKPFRECVRADGAII